MVYREEMLIRDLFPSDEKLVQYRSFATRYKIKQLRQKNRAALSNISIHLEGKRNPAANLDTALLPEFLFNGKQKPEIGSKFYIYCFGNI